VLQLAVQKGVLEQSGVVKIVKKCRSIVTTMHHSAQLTHGFKEKQVEITGKSIEKSLLLMQDVEVRWNSTYLMLERFLRLKAPVQLFMLNNETKFKVSPISEPEFDLIEKACHILKPFFELTKRFSSNKVSVADVIPGILTLRLFLERCQLTNVGTFKGTLKKYLEESFFSESGGLNILTNALYTIPTLLHPAYRNVIPAKYVDDAKGSLLTATVKLANSPPISDDETSSMTSESDMGPNGEV